MTRRQALLALTAAVIGCDDTGTGVFISGANLDAGSLVPSSIEWRATLSPSNASSPLRGEAIVRMNATEQTFTAMLALRGDASGARRPWHIHFGSCMTRGAIVGGDDAYPRLDIGDDGTATANAAGYTGLDPTLPYFVDVHASDAKPDAIVVCGALVPR